MNDATPDLAFGGASGAGTAQPVPMLGVTAYLDVYWSKMFCSAIGYSMVQMWNTSLQPANSFKSGQYASVNFLVAPVRNLLLGPEFLYGERIDKNGAWGTDTRLQVSVKYSFTSLDFWKPN
jgi:hypothetical protein